MADGWRTVSNALPLRSPGTAPGQRSASAETQVLKDRIAELQKRVEKMSAEATDTQRRIHEKDARNGELQKMVTTAQQRTSGASESLAVEQAERKLVEQALRKYEAEAADLRLQLAPLQGRVDRAEGASAALQPQIDASALEVRTCQDALAAARREIAAVETAKAEAIGRAEAATAEVRAELSRRDEVAASRIRTLETQCEEARRECLVLQKAQSTAEAEARLTADAMGRTIEQAEAERTNLRMLLSSSADRLEVAQSQQAEDIAERERALSSVAVAHAERQMLQELSSRVQEQLLHERGMRLELT